jgi:hypothetical protein
VNAAALEDADDVGKRLGEIDDSVAVCIDRD